MTTVFIRFKRNRSSTSNSSRSTSNVRFSEGRGTLLLVATDTGTSGKRLRKCSCFGSVGRLGVGLLRRRAIQVCIHDGHHSTVSSKFCRFGRRRAIQVFIHTGNAGSVVPSKFSLIGHLFGELWRRLHDSRIIIIGVVCSFNW